MLCCLFVRSGEIDTRRAVFQHRMLPHILQRSWSKCLLLLCCYCLIGFGLNNDCVVGQSIPMRNHLSNTTCLTHVFFKAASNAANSISRIRQVMPQGRHSILTTCRKDAKDSFPLPPTGPYRLRGPTSANCLAARCNNSADRVFQGNLRTGKCAGLRVGSGKHNLEL